MRDVAENIIVVGGGPVGLSFALAAARHTALNVHLIESAAPPLPPTDLQFDHRIYALSPASKAFLESIGVWQDMPRERIARVTAMRVWGDDRVSELELQQRSALAFIVESNRLSAALWAQVRGQTRDAQRITVHAPCKPAALSFDQAEEGATLTLHDGTQLNAALVVGADGANSWVRQQAGLRADTRSYESFAVVANFECEKTHGGVARQWFAADSVLAWLPLPGKKISIVWSTGVVQAERLMQLSPAALADAVRLAGDESLGALKCVSPVARFPLQRILASPWVAAHLALMGDAAHVIHPLAGQGVNLGFSDARLLSELLGNKSRLSSSGDLALLRKYERGRKENVMAMTVMTDQLKTLFSQRSKSLTRLRNAGLAFTDRQRWLKRRVMQYAMRG